MSGIKRRGLFGTAAAAVGSGVLADRFGRPASAHSEVRDNGLWLSSVGHEDPRYASLRSGNNQRFVANPDRVYLVTTGGDVEHVLGQALRNNARVSIRSGGHCFSDLVCNSSVKAIVDLSRMRKVYYDQSMQAFAVEPGARLLEVYEELFSGWGVTIPGGICYSVGAGGHIAGGGYGLLSRDHGLTVDHLSAVEVVTVGRSGTLRTIVATKDPLDPNHDLWWAHTGGGGGSFGIVTRYWFRTSGTENLKPQEQLVRPPSTVLVTAAAIPWNQLTEGSFSRLLMNFGQWHQENSRPDQQARKLSCLLNVCHQAHGKLEIFTQVDGDVPYAAELIRDFNEALMRGTGLSKEPLSEGSRELGALEHIFEPKRLPWLQAARLVGTNNPTITNATSRGAHKSAYMKTGFSRGQVSKIYHHMTSPEFNNPEAMIVMFSYGGAVNRIASHATAAAQRSAAFKLCFQTFWHDETGDAANLGWARRIYEDVYAEDGGVPVNNDKSGGCYINYPDADVADTERNRSGVSWEALYYGDNYARLQDIKRRYDPTDFFQHRFSVRL